MSPPTTQADTHENERAGHRDRQQPVDDRVEVVRAPRGRRVQRPLQDAQRCATVERRRLNASDNRCEAGA